MLDLSPDLPVTPNRSAAPYSTLTIAQIRERLARDHASSSPDVTFWQQYGFSCMPTSRDISTGTITTTVPAATVAIVSNSPTDNDSHVDLLKAIGIRPGLTLDVDGKRQTFFGAEEEDVVVALRSVLPNGVSLCGPGDPVALPSGIAGKLKEHESKSIAELPVLSAQDLNDLPITKLPALPPV